MMYRTDLCYLLYGCFQDFNHICITIEFKRNLMDVDIWQSKVVGGGADVYSFQQVALFASLFHQYDRLHNNNPLMNNLTRIVIKKLIIYFRETSIQQRLLTFGQKHYECCSELLIFRSLFTEGILWDLPEEKGNDATDECLKDRRNNSNRDRKRVV